MPFYNSRPVKPPRPEHVTPKLRKLRAEWYASNPSKPDWASNEVQQRAAFLTLRERQQAA